MCEERGCVNGELGRGWVAYLCEDPDTAEPTTLIVYCPPCAASEFAHRPGAAYERDLLKELRGFFLRLVTPACSADNPRRFQVARL